MKFVNVLILILKTYNCNVLKCFIPFYAKDIKELVSY